MLIGVPVAAFSGFQVYAGTTTTADANLGDLSAFKAIIADVQTLAAKGDQTGAAKRITDYEAAWDAAETAIRPLNPTQWTNIDAASDDALKALRRSTPKADEVTKTLAALMTVLTDPSKEPQ